MMAVVMVVMMSLSPRKSLKFWAVIPAWMTVAMSREL